MKSLHQVYHIDADPEDVWHSLVDPEKIDQWGGGPARMDDHVGTEFTLWGGDIWGKNTEVDHGHKLTQEWYSGKWPKPSVVTFNLTADDNGTRVDLDQHDIPDEELDDIADGWKTYYMGEIKKMLEDKL